MKKVFIALFVAVLTLSAGLPDAEARRLGGGGSFGKQSQKASRPQPMQNQAAAPAKPAAAPAAAGAGAAAAAKPSMWKGLLGGALLGLGLGALLSSLGLGGAMASMISTLLTFALIAMVAMLAYRWYKRRTETSRPAFANGGAAFSGNPFQPKAENRFDAAQPMALQSTQFGAAAGGAAPLDALDPANAAPWGVPADFDTQAFLRHAKTYFIRLQAAWDKADVNDISEFTTPEMFAEIKMQIHERGAAANHTDVMELDAQLLGIDTINDEYLASVQFSGMIKEDPETPTAPFTEVWNLSKPVAGQGGWMLAGIQQQKA